MGILVKRGQSLQYHPFLIENLNKKSEAQMLEAGLDFLRSLSPPNSDVNIPIFHWSSAEPRALDAAGFALPDNCEWIDLYSHIRKNGASIPGSYSYGLKDVGQALYKLKKIKSKWLYGLDGTSAMVMAWNIHHKCEITGERFRDDPRIQKLTTYNWVDCQVMEEIRQLL